MLLSRCKHLKVKVNRANPNWSMRYCDLLPKGVADGNFMKISEKFKELHPDLSFVPNGECPWAPHADSHKCPFYCPQKDK